MRSDVARIWPQARRRARRSGADGVHVARETRRTTSSEQHRKDAEDERRVLEGPLKRLRAAGDRVAEEVGRPGPERAAGRHRVALVTPALGPGDGLRPLRLQVGAGGAVEESALELAPAALVVDPGIGVLGGVRVARDRDHGRPQVDGRSARVVAADPLLGRAAQIEPFLVEVGVRAGGRVDDGVRPVHDLELVLAPVGLLGALVLAVADSRRLDLERRGGVLGLEDELDHLPVAFVEVVPVVVGVEEPVLERQLAGVARVAGDVCVDGRGVALAQAARPKLVGAARVERVSGEVEVVLVQAVREVVGRRRDLDEVAAAPGPAQRDRGLVEEEVDVQRLVRLTGPAFLELLDEADHRCVALGEGDFVLEVGCGRRCGCKRRHESWKEGPGADSPFSPGRGMAPPELGRGLGRVALRLMFALHYCA